MAHGYIEWSVLASHLSVIEVKLLLIYCAVLQYGGH